MQSKHFRSMTSKELDMKIHVFEYVGLNGFFDA